MKLLILILSLFFVSSAAAGDYRTVYDKNYKITGYNRKGCKED